MSNLENSFLYKIALIADPNHSFISFGPKLIPLNLLINIQKAGTIFVMFLLMVYCNNYSLGAWVYLSLHGTYGIIWILKDCIFPDKTFKQLVTIPVAFLISIVLMMYWGIGFLMIFGYGDQNPSPRRIFLSMFVFTLGLFFMVCTDLQKFIILSHKKGLIDTYFLARNRNTNYMGEMMIYFSFVFITNHIIGYLIVIAIWISLFSCRMYLKEVSLSKKEGYKHYKENSYLFLFKIVDSDIGNIIIYSIIILLFILVLYI